MDKPDNAGTGGQGLRGEPGAVSLVLVRVHYQAASFSLGLSTSSGLNKLQNPLRWPA